MESIPLSVIEELKIVLQKREARKNLQNQPTTITDPTTGERFDVRSLYRNFLGEDQIGSLYRAYPTFEQIIQACTPGNDLKKWTPIQEHTGGICLGCRMLKGDCTVYYHRDTEMVIRIGTECATRFLPVPESGSYFSTCIIA